MSKEYSELNKDQKAELYAWQKTKDGKYALKSARKSNKPYRQVQLTKK